MHEQDEDTPTAQAGTKGSEARQSAGCEVTRGSLLVVFRDSVMRPFVAALGAVDAHANYDFAHNGGGADRFPSTLATVGTRRGLVLNEPHALRASRHDAGVYCPSRPNSRSLGNERRVLAAIRLRP